MTPFELIQSLESENSRKIKESHIQNAWDEGCIEFFQGARLAYDALITFGVKKVPEHKGPGGEGLDWNQFKVLVDNLISRSLTGNAAREAIEKAMSVSTKVEWNDWYRRILIKDLRCGITEKTINSVLQKNSNAERFIVPVFTCQLAHDGSDHPKKMIGEKIVEVKLDGVRVLTVVYPSGRVDQYSRNGKELLNFEHIKSQFASIAENLTEPMVYDGEVMSNSFQDLMKQIHRKENVATNDAVLYLFDMLPLENFQNGGWLVDQITRMESLRDFVESNAEQLQNVRLLDQEIVDLDTNEGQTRFREINASAISGGYEGLMLKDITAPYELKRSYAWLKIKPTITVDLEVISIEEGTGKNVGKLGAFVCEGIDNGKRIQVNVGSGFTDEQRDSYWNNKNNVLGNTVEVLADAVTMNQDGSYSLRFPRFVRFRGFEPGEKF